MGSPTYSRELADKICAQMSEGKSLRGICSKPGMPPASTVRGWVVSDIDGFGGRYSLAREAQADALFDELEETAAEALSAESAVEIAARRLLIDTQKWRISKIVPSRYGDKVTQEHTGPGGGAIKQALIVEFVNAGPVSDEA